MALPDVVVDVVGGDYPDSQPASQLYQVAVALSVAMDQVLLELQVDVLRSEPLRIPAGGLFRLFQPALLCQGGDLALAAAGQQDQATSMLGGESGGPTRAPGGRW